MIEHYMRQTLQLAESALEQGELPIAALVVLNDKIITQAIALDNQSQRFLIHAELLALEAADKILPPNPDDRRQVKLFTNLEPCLMCLGAAMSFFAGEVYYGLESKADGAVDLVQTWHRNLTDIPDYQLPKIVGGVLREESANLFGRYAELHPHDPIWTNWAKSLATQNNTLKENRR